MKKLVFRMAGILALFMLPTLATAAPVKWKVDGGHSSVIFSVKHFNAAWFYGSFRRVKGHVVLDRKTPKNSSISVTIKAKSVFTANKKRDKHLRNADFFNVKRYPNITFKSKSISRVKKGHFKVNGALTFHGVTKNISVVFKITGKGKDPWGNVRLGTHAKFHFKRSNFGVKYMLGGLSDRVNLIVSLELVRRAKK